MPPPTSDVFDTVRSVLVETLGVEPEAVTPGAVLKDDLGAESIDFLHIVFELEHVFSIKIPREELFPESVLNNPRLRKGGPIPSDLLAELKRTMPYADHAVLDADPRVERLSSLFTVGAVVRYVAGKLPAATS